MKCHSDLSLSVKHSQPNRLRPVPEIIHSIDDFTGHTFTFYERADFTFTTRGAMSCILPIVPGVPSFLFPLDSPHMRSVTRH